MLRVMIIVRSWQEGWEAMLLPSLSDTLLSFRGLLPFCFVLPSMALSMVQQENTRDPAACGSTATSPCNEVMLKSVRLNGDQVMVGKHVFHIEQLFLWLKMELEAGECCLAFLCGAPSSGKSEKAREAARQFGTAVHIVSNDLASDKEADLHAGITNPSTANIQASCQVQWGNARGAWKVPPPLV